MTMLLPGYKEQLGQRATDLATAHERRPRSGSPTTGRAAPSRRGPSRRHLGLGVLIAGIALSGGAYASQGWWRPSMGDDQRGHPVASASPLPPALLAKYAVLRRPQNDDDRGAGSRDALRWQGGGSRIQTDGVRRVGTGYRNTAIVVIPMTLKRRSGLPKSRSVLCLWQQDPAEAGGMVCASDESAAVDGVKLTMITEPPEPASLARRRAAFMRAHPRGGRMPRSLGLTVPGTAHITGLVPDGVATVRAGSGPGTVEVPVRGNVFQASMSERYMVAPQVWLDAQGRVVGPPPTSRRR